VTDAVRLGSRVHSKVLACPRLARWIGESPPARIVYRSPADSPTVDSRPSGLRWVHSSPACKKSSLCRAVAGRGPSTAELTDQDTERL
jgi:hypothetical protein